MITNYFKVAWRNLIRNKAFSTINIMGLALGISCSLLIMLWVLDEKQVDGFHVNGKYLYQVFERHRYDGKVEASYPTQGLLADELKKVVPEVEYASGMEYASMPGTLNTFEAGEKIIKMGGYYAGADFFKMFSYPLLQGGQQSVLTSPEAIAISRKMAMAFFGSVDNAIGKTIRFENKEDLRVSGVFENVPSTSSIRFDFVRSWAAFVRDNKWVHNWGNTSPNTFVQLRDNADRFKVESKIRDFIYRYAKRDNSFVTELALQPYPDKYLFSGFKNGEIAGGRIEYVRLFTLVAAFILLIACVNFMNLATSRSARRAKEVGVRKVVGAPQYLLVSQFIGEAMLLTLISAIIGVCLAAAVLPSFNELTSKDLFIPVREPFLWLGLLGLTIATGLVAGSYPALYLSSLNAAKVLKAGLKFSWASIFLRKGLVVFQFALAMIMIIGMIVVYRQMDYVQSANLGYDRENLLYIPIEGDLIKNYSVFKERAQQLPGVLNVSKMRNSPTVIEHHTGSIEWPGKDPNASVSFADAVVGYDFAKTLNLQMKAGRDFSRAFGTDSASYLLNETAVQKIGLTDPIGKIVAWGNRKGQIIGVLKDFHFNSMHQSIEPLIVRLDENWGWGTILVRTERGKTQQAIAGLESLCKMINPKVPFTYQFSDLEYDKLYRSEQIVSRLSNYFAFLAIFISCLGLLGLAAFTAEQRTKEIGVRKVLGASAGNIVGLLATQFLRPVSLAMIVAFPIAWYATNSWLQDFAYKIKIDWWIFAAAGMATVLIAMLTVSFQSIRAALINPVKSLRTE